MTPANLSGETAPVWEVANFSVFGVFESEFCASWLHTSSMWMNLVMREPAVQDPLSTTAGAGGGGGGQGGKVALKEGALVIASPKPLIVLLISLLGLMLRGVTK